MKRIVLHKGIRPLLQRPLLLCIYKFFLIQVLNISERSSFKRYRTLLLLLYQRLHNSKRCVCFYASWKGKFKIMQPSSSGLCL